MMIAWQQNLPVHQHRSPHLPLHLYPQPQMISTPAVLAAELTVVSVEMLRVTNVSLRADSKITSVNYVQHSLCWHMGKSKALLKDFEAIMVEPYSTSQTLWKHLRCYMKHLHRRDHAVASSVRNHSRNVVTLTCDLLIKNALSIQCLAWIANTPNTVRLANESFWKKPSRRMIINWWLLTLVRTLSQLHHHY